MQPVTRLARLVGVTALIVITIAVGPRASADAVTAWNAIASTVIISYAVRPPPAALVDMAYVQAAVYDAVNAIDGRYSVYSVRPTTVARRRIARRRSGERRLQGAAGVVPGPLARSEGVARW